MSGAIVILIVGVLVYVMACGSKPDDHDTDDAFYLGLMILAGGWLFSVFAFAP